MPDRKLTPVELEKFRATLLGILEVVRGNIDHLSAHTTAYRDGAALTGEGETYLQDVSFELLELDDATRREVEDALERIEDGTYGRCESCDRWIPRARLRAIPFARRCVDCQRELERAG